MIVIKGKIKHRAWTCLNCKHKKNIDSEKCAICKYKKPIERIYIHYGGCNFLCRAHTSINSPIVSVMRTFPSSDAFLTIPLIITSPSVLECIMDAFEFSEELRQLCVSGAAEIGGKSVIEEACKLPDHTPTLEIPAAELIDETTGIVNRDIFTSATPELHGVSNCQSKGALALGNAPKSLFEQVVENANNLVYDLSTGRYVGKPKLPSGMTPVEKRMAQSALVASLPNNLVNVADSAYSYVDKMKKSKQSLQKAMVISIKTKGNLDTVHGGTSRIISKYEQLVNPVKKVPCGLCGIDFPETSLLGKVTKRAIVNWREAHGAPDGMTHAQKTASAIYSAAKVCLYCFQFFDEGDFGKVFEESYKLRDEIFGNIADKVEDKQKLASAVSKKPPRVPKKVNETKISSPKSKRRNSNISLSPINVPETNQAETALSLVKRLKQQGSSSMRSTSSDSFVRKKTTNLNSVSRPMSALDTEIAKSNLRTRHTMGGLSSKGLNSNAVPSILRDKYKSIKSVYQELMEGDKQTSRINQKMKRRKIRYEQALKNKKLRDSDFAEHTSKHPEKSKVLPTPKRRNARNLSIRDVSQLVGFPSPKPSDIPRRGGIDGGNSADDELDEIDEEVSELADRLLNPMEEDLDSFFDDRSLPVSYGQLKDRTQVKLVRALNGNRGGRHNPYYDSKQNGNSKIRRQIQHNHKKSMEEEKEADFNKVLNHALRKKSVIGQMIRSKIDKSNAKRDMWKKNRKEKAEELKSNLRHVNMNGNRMRGKDGKLGGRARGNRGVPKNTRKPPPRRHVNSRNTNINNRTNSRGVSKQTTLKPIKESSREKSAALKHMNRNKKTPDERSRMGGAMKPPVNTVPVKNTAVAPPHRTARQPLVMFVPNKGDSGTDGSVKRIEASLPPISHQSASNEENINARINAPKSGYASIVIRNKVDTNEMSVGSVVGASSSIELPDSVLEKTRSFTDRPTNNTKVPKKLLVVETTRKSMDLGKDCFNDIDEPVETLDMDDGNDENSYYSDSFEEEVPIAIDITVNSAANPAPAVVDKINHMVFVSPDKQQHFNSNDDVKISDDIEEELAPLEFQQSQTKEVSTPVSVNKYANAIREQLRSGAMGGITYSLPPSPGPILEDDLEGMDDNAWQQYWGGAEAIEFRDGERGGGALHNVDFDSPPSRNKQSRQGERDICTAAVDITFQDLREGALDPIPTNTTTHSAKAFSKPSSRQGGRNRMDANVSHVGIMRALSRSGTATGGLRDRGSSRGAGTGAGTPGENIRLLSAKHDLHGTPSNRDRDLTSAGGRRTYSRDNSNMNVMVAL